MRELAIQSATDTMTTTERSYTDKEFGALKSEITRIGSSVATLGHTFGCSRVVTAISCAVTLAVVLTRGRASVLAHRTRIVYARRSKRTFDRFSGGIARSATTRTGALATNPIAAER